MRAKSLVEEVYPGGRDLTNRDNKCHAGVLILYQLAIWASKNTQNTLVLINSGDFKSSVCDALFENSKECFQIKTLDEEIEDPLSQEEIFTHYLRPFHTDLSAYMKCVWSRYQKTVHPIVVFGRENSCEIINTIPKIAKREKKRQLATSGSTYRADICKTSMNYKGFVTFVYYLKFHGLI